jgi:hypothetical protein
MLYGFGAPLSTLARIYQRTCCAAERGSPSKRI